MKLSLLCALLLFTLPLAASAAPAPNPAPRGRALPVGAEEKQCFALGVTLARGAFAYAGLAKQASALGKGRGTLDQVGGLARLDPAAGRGREVARTQIGRAVLLMRQLHAPAPALAPVLAAAARLTAPLRLSGDAKTLSYFNRAAARTVGALSEFESLSSLPNDPALRAWLSAPARPGAIWYGPGKLAGLSEIAAVHEMPDLLPPAAEVAADLRGLRGKLTGQDTLTKDLNLFLADVGGAAQSGPVDPDKPRLLSLPQLQALGSLSRRLQSAVLGEAFIETRDPEQSGPRSPA